MWASDFQPSAPPILLRPCERNLKELETAMTCDLENNYYIVKPRFVGCFFIRFTFSAFELFVPYPPHKTRFDCILTLMTFDALGAH